jgi:predicted DCC family thiol-disulfide oxidoreductase YuxK
MTLISPAPEQRSPSLSTPSLELTPTTPSWKIKLLYDGECPLCLREVDFLKRRDAGRGLVAFIDIADAGYSSEDNGGVDFTTAMGRIHAVLPDGTVIKNVEVFRQVYEVLGMGWVYAITKLPVIGWLADALYGIWAKWRLQLTGRPDLATLVRDRQNRLQCDLEGRCGTADETVRR